MFDSLLYIFNPANFEAHGLHFTDTPGLFWSFIVANLVTFIAYTLIPIALVYFIRKRRDMVFQRVFIFFGLFIVLCGIHHLLHVVTFFYPIYGIVVVNDILMAIVSIGTFFGLLYILPTAIKLRSPAETEKTNNQLIKEIETRKQTEAQLKKNEAKMQEALVGFQVKTRELEKTNKTMVDRELKMIELKQEIEKLKNK